MIEVHLHGGGVIRLQRVDVGYYQVVHVKRTGEIVSSPLFQNREVAVKWAIRLIAQDASPSKAG